MVENVERADHYREINADRVTPDFHPEGVYFSVMTHSLYISPLIKQLLTKDINNLTQNIDLNMILSINKVFNCFR